MKRNLRVVENKRYGRWDVKTPRSRNYRTGWVTVATFSSEESAIEWVQQKPAGEKMHEN